MNDEEELLKVIQKGNTKNSKCILGYLVKKRDCSNLMLDNPFFILVLFSLL